MVLFLTAILFTISFAYGDEPVLVEPKVSPAAVGWGNLFVPGLGSTLRGHPTRGLTEATAEIGLFYGGTFNVHEENVQIDGSVVIPESGHIYKPLIGQTLQELGLKLHMYDTFYNYQQAAINSQETSRELENPQPLYHGNARDVILAPFRWRNLSEPLVLTAVVLGGSFLIYKYQSNPVEARPGLRATRDEDNFYATNQIGIIPFGGALGEEPLFRGFIQREVRGYTHSLWMSIAAETALFVVIHPDSLKLGALGGGLAYGLMTEYYHGHLEPSIAAHFWLNVIDGVIAYWTFHRVQQKDTPFAPPITAQMTIPF